MQPATFAPSTETPTLDTREAWAALDPGGLLNGSVRNMYDVLVKAQAHIARLYKALDEADVTMPAPDALVDDDGQGEVAAMFYYAAADTRLDLIAEEQGFDWKVVDLFDVVAEDDPLTNRYDAGEDVAAVLRDWHPEIPEGWTLGGKLDSEDGPFAFLLRKRTER